MRCSRCSDTLCRESANSIATNQLDGWFDPIHGFVELLVHFDLVEVPAPCCINPTFLPAPRDFRSAARFAVYRSRPHTLQQTALVQRPHIVGCGLTDQYSGGELHSDTTPEAVESLRYVRIEQSHHPLCGQVVKVLRRRATPSAAAGNEVGEAGPQDPVSRIWRLYTVRESDKLTPTRHLMPLLEAR